MITKRDCRVAFVAAVLAATGAWAFEHKSVAGSTVFDWNAMTPHKTEVGEVRSILRARTATLDELEIHVTTLDAGKASHPPHQHANEELVIVKEGTLEAYVNGEWKRVGPGSVIFAASGQLHGVRNVGAGPATYHVVNWKSATTPAK